MNKTLLLAIIITASFGISIKAEESKPNIVLFLADDLGWTGLSCFGSDYYETPNIDRLAKRGMRFDHGFAAMANCAPSRAAILSGQYTPRHKVMYVSNYQQKWKKKNGNIERFKLIQPDRSGQIPDETKTIGETMQKAGYATAMFGKWHLGPRNTQHPSMRGFDIAIESSGHHFNFTSHPEVEHSKEDYLSDVLTDQAIKFIDKSHQAKKPFFLYEADFLVHAPLETKEKYLEYFRNKPKGKNQKSPYAAAMIKSLDDSVGRIMDKLDELGITDNTLFIFTSDNGGLGYEEDGKRKNNTSNAPLKGQKGMEFDGGLRVPYIFSWPGHIPEDTLNTNPIIGVDLYPTILAAAKAPQPPQPLDGINLLPILEKVDSEFPVRDLFWYFPMYSAFNRPCVIARRGEMKLIHLLETGECELYHTGNDIGESHDISKENTGTVASMKQRTLDWLKSTNAPRMIPNPEYIPKRNRK